MNGSTLQGFVNNSALLLALGVLYDLLTPNKNRRVTSKKGLLSGIILGCIGVAIMLNPWFFSPGVIFDSRSILLSLSGLYFGAVPTGIAVLFTGLMRIYQGGDGTLTGLCVIITSALIGLAWSARRRPASNIYGWLELYFLGITVHVAMLLWMFTLPGGVALAVLEKITLPVMAINPLATVLLGLMLSRQQLRRDEKHALQNSEEGLRQIIQNMPVLLDAFDEHYHLIAWNRECERATGYTAAEMIGNPSAAFNLYPDGEERGRLLKSLEREESGFRNQKWTVTCKDGTKRVILWSNISRDYPIPGWHSWAVGVDVTDQLRAEAAMRASEAKYRKLFQSMTTAFVLHEVLLDAQSGRYDCRILEMNDAYEKMSGLNAERSIGRTLREMIQQVDESLIERIAEVGKSGKAAHFEYTKPASESWFDVICYSPGPGQAAALFMDVTERKKGEENRLRMERQVLEAQKLESLGVMAGGIAHDFNNLLMAIQGNLDLVAEDGLPESTVHAAMKDAIRAVKRASELTRQMLAYSGKGRFLTEEIKLTEMIRSNMDMWRAAVSKAVLLDFQLDTEAPAISADRSELQQVLVNLLTNASESMAREQGIIRVSTGSGWFGEEQLKSNRTDEKPAPGCYVWMDVSDTGCGMDENTQARLFEPFFTTKFTGRGMGMAAVMGIVRGCHGAVFVESRVGKGSSVRVLFPAVVAQHAAPETVPSAEPMTIPAPIPLASSQRDVLVIDDDDMVRCISTKALQRSGFRVYSAANGEEGIQLFRDHAPGICGILLDLTMPGMGGESAFYALQAICPDVPVILCSGYSEQEAAQSFQNKRPIAFLQKPYSTLELRQLAMHYFAEKNQPGIQHP